MDKTDLYRSYLDDVKLMQLATARDNKPWLCNVWYVIDDDGVIYWMSRDTRRHSEEIHDNENVACTFHLSFDEGLGQKGQAVIMSGIAKKLDGNACKKPYELYASRFPKLLEFQSLDAFLNNEGHHYFYKMTPEEIIWWDEVNFGNDPRQKIEAT